VPGELENATSSGYFGIEFEKNSSRKIARLSRNKHFRKAPSLKCFPSTRKRQAFQNLHFRDGLVWTVGQALEFVENLSYEIEFGLRDSERAEGQHMNGFARGLFWALMEKVT